MDRVEAITVFLTALDAGSFAAAARRLKRSPAAVSPANAFLEDSVGAELLHRTTRSTVVSEAGERYATACRRILADLEEAVTIAGGEHAVPRGILSISAPPISGEDVLRSILDDFLDAYPMVSVRVFFAFADPDGNSWIARRSRRGALAADRPLPSRIFGATAVP